MSYSITTKPYSISLPPATPVLLIPFNANRRYLGLQVTGVNPGTFKFGSAPTSATDGMTLSGASVSGGQGGSLSLADDGKTLEVLVPVDAIYVYSALGTTVTGLEGTVAPFV